MYDFEHPDLILVNIPKNSYVKGARIATLPAEGFLLSVETVDGYEDGIAKSIHLAKQMFNKTFFSPSKWEYEDLLDD